MSSLLLRAIEKWEYPTLYGINFIQMSQTFRPLYYMILLTSQYIVAVFASIWTQESAGIDVDNDNNDDDDDVDDGDAANQPGCQWK